MSGGVSHHACLFTAFLDVQIYLSAWVISYYRPMYFMHFLFTLWRFLNWIYCIWGIFTTHSLHSLVPPSLPLKPSQKAPLYFDVYSATASNCGGLHEHELGVSYWNIDILPVTRLTKMTPSPRTHYLLTVCRWQVGPHEPLFHLW